ncbi:MULTISPECIES: hypothetical protein [Pantoea]|uniref:CS1 type fimbrial major subunit n=1 Tax=Pantoea allii TaxID=574096 RepID=A0A2V2BDJ9_9GAMM|nr:MULTISPECIES: hypothetical protein [Pantoea]MCH9299854.1 hypothetical protein [Pantoea allii]PWK94592.1 hypothetical protein C7431_11088 [Pantoea allii]PWV60349.1 hypothetical protein C7425_11210 [Pantoea ananatis]REC89200.1 hypothetical protein C7423_11371 [Pantoea ananatis]
MKMKTRLLTVLVAAGCFSQMAVADDLTTGSITNQTTQTATVTISQPITLENTLIPETGLKTGQSGMITLATGKLAIKESGVKARLALLIKSSEGEPNTVVTYATGHEKDDNYKLTYSIGIGDAAVTDDFKVPDGNYRVVRNESSSLNYVLQSNSTGLPKAGYYVVSVTGAVYNP